MRKVFAGFVFGSGGPGYRQRPENFMHEAWLIIVGQSRERGLGRFKFGTLPRIGEWVSIEEGATKQAFLYEVVMVAHAADDAGVDLYVKRIGPAHEALDALADRT